MKKLLLAGVLGLLVLPNVSFAQTPNCVSYYNGLSAKTPPWAPVYVYPPSGCTGPVKTPIQKNPNGKCDWGYYPGVPASPASAASPAWFPDQNRSSLWFWEKEPNVPGTYDVNWGTCDLMLQWTDPNAPPAGNGWRCNLDNPAKPFCERSATSTTAELQCKTSCAVKVDILINPDSKKYDTGQVLKFTPVSNVLSKLDKFNWDFGDGIIRNNETSREQPVVYTKQGNKKVSLSAYDQETNKWFATSTQIKVKCRPPVDDFIPTIGLQEIYLSQITKIPYNSFRDFDAENRKLIKDIIYREQQFCGYDDNVVNGEKAALQAYKYTQKRYPIPLSVVEAEQRKGEKLFSHRVIVLDVVILNAGTTGDLKFKIKILDPNGPKIGYLTNCTKRDKQFSDGSSTKIFLCDYTKDLNPLRINIGTGERESIDSYIYTLLNVCSGSSSREICKRKNSGITTWLENNYLNLNNTVENFPGTDGVCSGWSEFHSRMAYLADFVGECSSIPTSAAVGLTDLHQTLLKIREFLERSMPLLGR